MKRADGGSLMGRDNRIARFSKTEVSGNGISIFVMMNDDLSILKGRGSVANEA